MEKLKYSLQLLGSAFVWIVMGVLAFILFFGDFTVWLLTFWWDKRLFWLHRYSIFWAMFHVHLNPFWRIKFESKENIVKDKVYVIVSNHQSAFDIALLYRINIHFKWVAKRELVRVPVIGWNLLLNKYILIDRKNAFSSKKLLHEGGKNLKMGSSVLIFPEGTRTPDGRVKRFKEGAFLLAKQAQVSILPLVIEGSKDVLPKPGVISLIQTFTIRVLPEIPYESFKDTDVAELTKDVNKLIRDTHSQMEPKWYK
ncbi:MAG TPA: 1-acylglycerol-3-phosphate O-acyltransferase [Tenuifilaceae bacterium]|nr:1-acylglycerol-3-phosphate O-acyltransferase [Tenuifilaceae bacterium]HPN20494.1 1-acylglycerol-3-phosphate O-acyltransferase [Tenuifilaceae bacterium]HPV55791.1 1-acylglycerol-3-phosphate O-acyltransferase [Tenuifilaceae bacterium]